MAGFTNAESVATLDARFPVTGAGDYVGVSTNSDQATKTELAVAMIARTAIGATGWGGATNADPSLKQNANALTAAAVGGMPVGGAITSSSGTITCTGHQFANGDSVTLQNLTGGSAYTAGTRYFVVGIATNTFQLAATQGGSAITSGTNITVGTVYAHVISLAVFSASTSGTQRCDWAAFTGGPRDVSYGDQLTYAANSIVISLT